LPQIGIIFIAEHSKLAASQSEPHAGREATSPSIIIKVHKVQRGEEMPPNGGIVLPENVHV
jgi:hypothetical protein